MPTLGDRRASGHSIIGLAAFGRSALRAEAVGRCWSRGRMLAWLADSSVTPTYGSWMNLVERWFSALTTKKLQRPAYRSVHAPLRPPSLLQSRAVAGSLADSPRSTLSFDTTLDRLGYVMVSIERGERHPQVSHFPVTGSAVRMPRAPVARAGVPPVMVPAVSRPAQGAARQGRAPGPFRGDEGQTG